MKKLLIIISLILLTCVIYSFKTKSFYKFQSTLYNIKYKVHTNNPLDATLSLTPINKCLRQITITNHHRALTYFIDNRNNCYLIKTDDLGGEDVTNYKVKPDDTLKSIAKKFYGEMDYYFPLIIYNNLLNPYKLKVGDTIIIPNKSDLGIIYFINLSFLLRNKLNIRDLYKGFRKEKIDLSGLKDKINNYKITKLCSEFYHYLAFKFNSFEFCLNDFNNDGIEEIFCGFNCGYKEFANSRLLYIDNFKINKIVNKEGIHQHIFLNQLNDINNDNYNEFNITYDQGTKYHYYYNLKNNTFNNIFESNKFILQDRYRDPYINITNIDNSEEKEIIIRTYITDCLDWIKEPKQYWKTNIYFWDNNKYRQR